MRELDRLISPRSNPMNAADSLLSLTRVFILSGGAAKRAGGMNKSLIRIEGKSIIAQQIERLGPLFPSGMNVITDRPADYEGYSLSTFPDFEEATPEQRYPLRGLARALAEARDWIFLLASDMPWPSPELIRAQAARIADSTGEPKGPTLGLVLRSGGRIQPFHAFYHAALATSALAALSGEDRSLRGWIGSESSISILDALDLELDESVLSRSFEGFNVPPGKR